MRLPRVRFTVRRMMVAVAAVAVVVGCLALSRLGEDGSDLSHFEARAEVVVVAGGAGHVLDLAHDNQKIRIQGGTRASVVDDRWDDRDDGSRESRGVRPISVRLAEGAEEGMEVEIPRRHLRSR